MPIAIRDIDLLQLPIEIHVPNQYSHVLILIRLRGRPVGQTLLENVDGNLEGNGLRQALLNASGWTLWERWLHDYLKYEEVSAPVGKLPPATVAICTRDRSEDLKRCLEALLKMPNDGQEILVVDNCPSTDATKCLVQNYENVRYIHESRPGLDVARNRALREANYDIVVFADDDTVPDPEWLRALLRNFRDPQVLCVTGLTMPLELETEAQEWSERYSPFARGFRRTVFDAGNLHPLAAGQAGAGANMALRRSLLLKQVGFFDEALDAGTPACSGGDTEMFSRILAAGYRIVYEPAALSWHRHRRTWSELRKMLFGYGAGVYAFWTRKLLFEQELGVLKHAWGWFRHSQFPALFNALRRRPDSPSLDLIVAELRGCIAGPGAYIRARRRTVARS